MAFDPLDKQARTQWREMLSPADPFHAGVALLLFALSCLVLPFCDRYTVAMLYLFGAVLSYYLISRSFFAVIAVALPGVLLFALRAEGAPLWPAVYAAVLLGAVSGAYLLLHIAKTRQISFLCSILLILAADYGLAAFLTGRYVLPLLVLVPAVLAAALALCVLFCRPHTPSVITLAGVLMVLAAAIWLTALRYTGGNPLTLLADSVRTSVETLLRDAMRLYTERGLSLGIGDVDVSNAAILVANLFPGLLTVACGVAAAVMWRMLLRILLVWKTLPRVPARLAVMTLSPVGAALFVFCYLAALFANANAATLFGTVCQNLAIVFEPALGLVGYTSLVGRETERSCLSQLLAMGLVVLLFFRPGAAIAIAAFIGAFRILTATFLPRNKGGQ